MLCALKILLTIVPGADTEGLCALDSQGTYLKPADITAVAVVLRMDIFGLVFAERHLIDTKEGRAFAVGIVLPRAAPVVFNLREVLRQTHPHTELRHHRTVVGRRLIVHINADASVVDDGIGYLDIFDLFPHSDATGKAGRTLVVVLGLPEIGLQRGFQ